MIYRRFETRDRLPVYRMFRDSIWDYLLQNGMVTDSDANDVDAWMHRQQGFYQHLEKTAAEDWVAQDQAGDIVGWARSIERDGHLQLTHFFVAPSTQGQGAGKALLDRCFAPVRGRSRSIIATTNSSALSLYLRYGVSYRSMGFAFNGTPLAREIETDLQIEKGEHSDATLQQLLNIDSQILGFRRPEDLDFLLGQQPVYLFRRDGEVVAYAFGCANHASGPAAALDPADLPALLQTIEQSAVEIGQQNLALIVPAVAHSAVDWALESGYRLDKFYEVLLADDDSLQLDRYLLTECSFIW